MEWKHWLLVGLGGGVGSVFRTWVSLHFKAGFPWGVFIVNVVGSFLIGLLARYFDGAAEDRTDLRFLLVTGFCGGFTTFSAFSMDTLKLLRDSQPLLAGANVALNLACCLAAAFAGWQLARPAG